MSPAPREPVSPEPSNPHERSWTGQVSNRLVAPNEWEGETEEATDVVDGDRDARSHDPTQAREASTSEEVNIEEELDAEIAPPRIASDPGQPSRKQMAEHRIIHSPSSFALWAVDGEPPTVVQTTTAGRL